MFSRANDSCEQFTMDVDDLEWADVYAALCNEPAAETVAAPSSHSARPRASMNVDHLMPLRCVLIPPTPTPTPPLPSPSRQGRTSSRFSPKPMSSISPTSSNDSRQPQWIYRQPKVKTPSRPAGVSACSITHGDSFWASSGLTSPPCPSHRKHERSSSVISSTPSDTTISSSGSSLPRTPSTSSISFDPRATQPPAKSAAKSILTRSSSKHSAASTAKSVTFADTPVIHQAMHDWHATRIRDYSDDDYDYDYGYGSYHYQHDVVYADVPRLASTHKPKPYVKRRSLKGLIFAENMAKPEALKPEISRPLALGSVLPPSRTVSAPSRPTPGPANASIRSGKSSRSSRGMKVGAPLRGTPSMDSLRSTESRRSTESKRSITSMKSWLSRGHNDSNVFQGWLRKVGLGAG